MSARTTSGQIHARNCLFSLLQAGYLFLTCGLVYLLMIPLDSVNFFILVHFDVSPLLFSFLRTPHKKFPLPAAFSATASFVRKRMLMLVDYEPTPPNVHLQVDPGSSPATKSKARANKEVAWTDSIPCTYSQGFFIRQDSPASQISSIYSKLMGLLDYLKPSAIHPISRAVDQPFCHYVTSQSTVGFFNFELCKADHDMSSAGSRFYRESDL